MVAQANDTDLHLHVRKRFIELQSCLMVQKARDTGKVLVDLSREENLNIMVEVMKNVGLHTAASRGYKYTGTTNRLDGSEDHPICREAKIFWDERRMREKVTSAVAEVERQFHAGALPWNYRTVQSLIGAYPKHGHLDVIQPGQEDEATEDPDGVPWEPSGDEQEEEEIWDAPIADMDPADWRELPSPTDEIHGDGDDLFGDDIRGGGDHSQSPANTS